MNRKNHFLNYCIRRDDEGREVLSILRQELALTTRKIRSIKGEEEGILLDGNRVTVRHKVEEGQLLQIMLNDTEVTDHIVPWDNELEVLYEDEDMIFVNKPSGIVSHPSLGHKYDSLANIVKSYFLKKEEENGIHLIGRLDKDTSGVLGIAKNGVTKERMIGLRQDGKIHKEYIALVHGKFQEKTGFIDINMEEYRDAEDGYRLKMRKAEFPNMGMEAGTHYDVLEEYGRYSLVRLWLETGRMHQIRFHMAAIGHPLLGDSIYGKGNDFSLKRAALHAWKVTFPHPFTGKIIQIETKLPKDMREYIKIPGAF